MIASTSSGYNCALSGLRDNLSNKQKHWAKVRAAACVIQVTGACRRDAFSRNPRIRSDSDGRRTTTTIGKRYGSADRSVPWPAWNGPWSQCRVDHSHFFRKYRLDHWPTRAQYGNIHKQRRQYSTLARYLLLFASPLEG